MALLHVDLQEGFEAEPVVVSVNGQDAFHKPTVRTRTQIGLADSFELTVPPGDTAVQVTARGATARFTVPVQDTVYVGISITPEGKIVHRTSSQAFGYV
jgi:hypothetical protein